MDGNNTTWCQTICKNVAELTLFIVYDDVYARLFAIMLLDYRLALNERNRKIFAVPSSPETIHGESRCTNLEY